MRLRATILLLGLLSLSVFSSAQFVDTNKSRVPMTELTGPWRFHAGDDPAWSRADTDDSGWSLLTADKSWSEQGYLGYGGIAWYRLRVAITPQPSGLAFYLPTESDSCQVFANGKLIGTDGEMPPNGRYMNTPGRDLYPIPNELLIPGQPLSIAIRIWRWPIDTGPTSGGLLAPPRIGDTQTLAEWRKFQIRDDAWKDSMHMIECAGNALIALVCFGLFLLRRREPEFFWFGLSMSMWCLYLGLILYVVYWPIPFWTDVLTGTCAFILGFCFQLEFYLAMLRQKRGALYLIALIGFVLNPSSSIIQTLFPGVLPALVAPFAVTIAQACEVAMVYLGTRRRVAGARIVFVPLMIQFFCGIILLLAALAPGVSWLPMMARELRRGFRWPFPISFLSLAGDLTTLAVVALLIQRFARSRRDEERLEAELEAARIVQKVLIPEEIPSIPGLIVETAYKPAGQVGGDFFQIIATAEKGALIVIGDVSGKGMPAAMTVSLLVGTVRTLAHYTQSPGEILAAMNQRMLGRSKGGFTTCLVLRAEPTGRLTIANAGHIAPYLDGLELPLENGLPLGLSADSTYPESTFDLACNAQLTLMTDGVLEATSPSGELFGFDRTAAISSHTADQIVHAAKQFGQEDDITVLTLQRIAVPALSA